MLLVVIAAYPFVIAQAAQLMANLVPVLLGITSSLLLLLVIRRGSLATLSRARQLTQGRPAPRTMQAMRQLANATQTVSGTLRVASRSRLERVYKAVKQRLLRPHAPLNDAERWRLAGSLWLGIGGLLLSVFVFTA
jgi:hypothetical protein